MFHVEHLSWKIGEISPFVAKNTANGGIFTYSSYKLTQNSANMPNESMHVTYHTLRRKKSRQKLKTVPYIGLKSEILLV